MLTRIPMAAYPQELSRFIHSRYALVPLYISWAFWQAFTFFHYGVSPGGDTVRYVNAAHRILDGLLPTADSLFVADISPQGGFGRRQSNTGAIYQIKSVIPEPGCLIQLGIASLVLLISRRRSG